MRLIWCPAYFAQGHTHAGARRSRSIVGGYDQLLLLQHSLNARTCSAAAASKPHEEDAAEITSNIQRRLLCLIVRRLLVILACRDGSEFGMTERFGRIVKSKVRPNPNGWYPAGEGSRNLYDLLSINYQPLLFVSSIADIQLVTCTFCNERRRRSPGKLCKYHVGRTRGPCYCLNITQ
jgi:hypothetical protein